MEPRHSNHRLHETRPQDYVMPLASVDHIGITQLQFVLLFSLLDVSEAAFEDRSTMTATQNCGNTENQSQLLFLFTCLNEFDDFSQKNVSSKISREVSRCDGTEQRHESIRHTQFTRCSVLPLFMQLFRHLTNSINCIQDSTYEVL